MPFDDGAFDGTNVAPGTAASQAQDNDGIAAIPQGGAPVLSPTAQMTFGNAVTYGLPGLGVGLIDTLGQSLGVFHNDTVPKAMANFTGQGENSFGDFYTRHQEGLRTGGEVAGMLLPGLAAMKVLKTVNGLREAGALGEVASNSKFLDVLLGNSADLSAAEGKIATETASASADAGVWAGKTVNTPAINAAKRGYYAARAVDAARTTVAFELGNQAAFNSSSTFYPADYTLTDQAKWVGLGLVGGIGIDAIMAKYAVRNIMQTALKSTTSGAAADVLSVSPMAKDIDKTIFRPANRGVGITQYAALSADLKDTAKVSSNSAVLQSNLAQDQVNIKAVLSNQISNMAYDAHPILPRTALSEDQINLGIKALNKNNTALLFATKLAPVPADGAEDFYADIAKTLGKAQNTYNTEAFAASSLPDAAAQTTALNAAIEKIKPIEQAAAEMHYVLEGDGRWTVYKNRADNWLDQNSFDSIKRKGYTTPNTVGGVEVPMKNSKLLVKGDNDIVLHDNFVAEIPKSATAKDYSALYAAGSKMVKEWQPVEGQQFVLTPDVNWRTTEMTLALADANPAAKNAVKLGGGFSSLDDVRFHVLNEKVKGFLADMPDTARPDTTGLRARLASSVQSYTPAQVIQKYNFPEPNGLQVSPMLETIAHMKLQGMTDLNEMFPVIKNGLLPSETNQMDLLDQHLRETAGIEDASTIVPSQGPLLDQGELVGKSVQMSKPLFVAAKSTPMMARADAMILGRVQGMRDVQLERLSQIDPATSPLVTNVIGKIVTQGAEGGDLSGAANTARAVQTLQDGLVSGTGQVVYQDRINQQFPTLHALQLLAQDGDKWVDNYVATLANAKVTPAFASVISPKNKADLFDFNRIEQAYRHGWDIKGIEPAPNGQGYVFTLNPETAINSKLTEYHFPAGADDDAVAYLPDMSVTAKKQGYSPLIVSKPAADLAMAISEMSRQSGVENNALRVALGKNPIQIRDFHLPTPELSKEGTYFVKNSADRVIATYSEPGKAASNKLRAQAAADTLNKTTADTMHVAVPLDTVKAEHQINDDNFFSLIDYSDQLAKSGVGIKGGLAHTDIDTSDTTVRAMLKSLQTQYLNIGIRSRAAIFEPELNYARQAAQTAKAQGANRNLGGINIFDRYISTMFSQSPNTGKGTLGQMYGGLESGMDKALSWMNAHFTELTGSESNAAGARAMRTVLRSQSSEEEFNQFKKVLPEFSPFQETTDWAESTFNQKMPWTTRPIAAQISKLSSTMSLRFLDVGTAINNFAGLLTNTPAIMYALRKGSSESHEDWLSRTAAWGSQLADGTVTFSPMRAMNTAIRALWNGELTAPMLDAAKHGYFEPEYASLTKALTLPGNPSMDKLHNFTKFAVYAADKSEIISRQIAWGMGYKIGKDLHGFTDDKNAYIFANNFVNEMIGNYSPNNKPAMFQGAIGLPLGAFQTYMFNFYRRLYGAIERGDKATVLAQYAAQASVFGGKSVPGYRLWNSVFQSNSDGSDDFTTRINSKLAPGVGELLLNGSLSNIPKIFGGAYQGITKNKVDFSQDGLAFYSRGSVDFTQPPATLLDMSKAPPLQFLANVYKGVNATLTNVMSGYGSIQRQEEILAQFSTNRALKSIMELAADAKTDQRGQVIDMGTRDAIHVIAGVLGTQPSSTRAAQDASARQRNVQLTQENLRATLTDQTQSLLRQGNINVDDLQHIVHDYVKAGGNPQYIGQWFRNTFLTSTTPKVQQQLEQLGKSGKLLEFENMLTTLQQNQNPNQPKDKGN